MTSEERSALWRVSLPSGGTAGEGYLAMRVAYDLGHVQRARGRLGAALDTYQLGLLTCSQGGRELPAAGWPTSAWPTLLYERGAGRCPRSRRPGCLTRPTSGVHAAHGHGPGHPRWICQAQGDPSGALDAMEEAQGVGVSPDVVALMNPSAGAPSTAAARPWRSTRLPTGRERGLAIDQPNYPRELEYLVLARVLLAQQEYDRTLGLSWMLRSDASNQRRTNSPH